MSLVTFVCQANAWYSPFLNPNLGETRYQFLLDAPNKWDFYSGCIFFPYCQVDNPESEFGYNLTETYEVLQFAFIGDGGGYYLWIGYNNGDQSNYTLNNETPVIYLDSIGNTRVIADSLTKLFQPAIQSTNFTDFQILQSQQTITITGWNPPSANMILQES